MPLFTLYPLASEVLLSCMSRLCSLAASLISSLAQEWHERGAKQAGQVAVRAQADVGGAEEAALVEGRAGVGLQVSRSPTFCKS